MNCRRVQKLLPLFVEDDLSSAATKRIAAHLEWCGRCNWLADDYRESQNWLRGTPPPEFDEALLDELKKGVLSEISAARQKPSMLALLARRWNHRQVLALSAALLIVFFAIFIYVYRSQRDVRSAQEQAYKGDKEQLPANGVTAPPGTGAAPGAGLQHRRFSSSRHRAIAHGASQVVLRKTEANVLARASNQSAPSTHGGDAIDSKGVLRIEIQTSDPLIRIIWFAPREGTDQHQFKPATD